MKVLVTGAAGFIGSNLVDRLLADGHEVVGLDAFITGRREFLERAFASSAFRLIEADLLAEREILNSSMAGVEAVFHMAANADVRLGTKHPCRDLEQNIIVTWNVLEAMRLNSVSRIVFASTGSVYGEPEIFPTPESCPIPIQTSLYGASKMSAEGLIQAYAEGFGIQGHIFRFVSILGERYTHGHVFDFYKQLLAHPAELHVLGNGKQRKSYLYIQDCIDAIFCAVERASSQVNIFNLGTHEYCEVDDSVRCITEHLELNPKIVYSGGPRGWIGDNPFIFLDCSRIRSLGWQPKLNIKQALLRTLDYLIENQWLLCERGG